MTWLQLADISSMLADIHENVLQVAKSILENRYHPEMLEVEQPPPIQPLPKLKQGHKSKSIHSKRLKKTTSTNKSEPKAKAEKVTKLFENNFFQMNVYSSDSGTSESDEETTRSMNSSFNNQSDQSLEREQVYIVHQSMQRAQQPKVPRTTMKQNEKQVKPAAEEATLKTDWDILFNLADTYVKQLKSIVNTIQFYADNGDLVTSAFILMIFYD